MKKTNSYSNITIGLVVTTLAYHAFLNPYDISVGGITGAAVILHKYFSLPYTATLLLMNTALFLWGIREKGIAYTLRSLTAMIALGILLDLPLPIMTWLTPSSKITAMILGSVLSGIGYGMIVSANTSTGGSDLLAMIVVGRFPMLTIGLVMNAVDLIVVLTGGVFEGLQSIPFSLVAMLLCNGMIDAVAFWLGETDMPNWMKHLMTRRKPSYEPKQKRYVFAVCVTMFILIICIRSLMASMNMFAALA